MPFINEYASDQDIEHYQLPFKKNLPLEYKRIWTVDRERNFYLSCIGVSGNQAFEDNIKRVAHLYLDGYKFRVFLERGKGSLIFTENPYLICWSEILTIWSLAPNSEYQSELPSNAWQDLDVIQPLLGHRSLNTFITILKEALMEHKEGDSNENIHVPIVVQFGF
jgi:hypothetical protein